MSQRYIGGLIYNPPGGFSGYFDGSGDFLTAPDNAAFNLSGDFTIEAWVNVANISSEYCVFHNHTSNSNGVALTINSGAPRMLAGNGSWYILTNSSITIAANTWNHIAYTRSGSTWTIWVNGVSGGTATSSTTPTYSGGVQIGQLTSGVPLFFPGYISNLRVLKGTALYTSAFTPPVGPLQAITNTSLLTCAYPTFRDGSSNNFTITVNGNTAVSTQNPFPQTQLPNPALGNQGNGVYSMSQYQALRSQNLWPAIDPYFDYVTLMLHGNGTNGAQNNTFLDSSTNNFTITRNGNTTQGTFSPYGSNWSNYFDGNGDSLSYTGGSSINFGTGDFTIELWAYLTNTGTFSAFLRPDDTGTFPEFGYDFSTGQLKFDARSGAIVAVTTTMPTNQWAHIVACRSGTNLRLFINGAQVGTTTTNSTNFGTTTGAIRIGGSSFSASHSVNGYLSNYRIVKGTALYTSNFTPPVNPLTVITNTSLLTCADNRFIDDSSNNFTITANGNTSIQRFSPFAPTTPYAAGTIGGSGYFDGTNDYLSLASNAAFNYGTGDFQFDFWIYPTGGSGPILEQRVNPSTAPYVGYDATNQRIEYYINSGGTLLTATPNGSVQPNQWSFITVSRVSNTSRIFVNGVERSSAADNNNYGTTYLLIGASISGGGISSSTFPGYMGDYRVVKGSGVSSGFSVPTSPLTAITNTSLLCNFTNAAIIDNAMMNDLETVGNAQISTSVSKFGGGSIYLDGTDDRLTAINRENFNFGTGDFTVEFWINASASGSFTQVVGTLVTGTEAGTWRVGNRFNSTNAVYFARGNGTGYDEFNAAVNVNDGAWHHVAVARASGTVRMFVDGTQVASSSITGTCSSSNPLTIGYNQRDNTYVTGYIDDLRITKGYARYTTSFTPQRSQWQDQ